MLFVCLFEREREREREREVMVGAWQLFFISFCLFILHFHLFILVRLELGK